MSPGSYMRDRDFCLESELDNTFTFEFNDDDPMGQGTRNSHVKPVLGSPELLEGQRFDFPATSPISEFYEQQIMLPETSHYTHARSPQTGSGNGGHGVMCSQPSGPTGGNTEEEHFANPSDITGLFTSRTPSVLEPPIQTSHLTDQRKYLPATPDPYSTRSTAVPEQTIPGSSAGHARRLINNIPPSQPYHDNRAFHTDAGSDCAPVSIRPNDDLLEITDLLQTNIEELKPYISSQNSDPDLTDVLSEIPNEPGTSNFSTVPHPFGESASQQPITQNAYRGTGLLGVNPFPPPPLSQSSCSTEHHQNTWAPHGDSEESQTETMIKPEWIDGEQYTAHASTSSIPAPKRGRKKRKGGMTEDEIQREIDKKRQKDQTQNVYLLPSQFVKKERRKKQNREAAARCRTKKKSEVETLEEEEQMLTENNSKIQDEIEALKNEMTSLQLFLNNHQCQILNPSSVLMAPTT